MKKKGMIPMEKFMKKMWKKSEGFTLVELIVVIAILGILAAVAVPAYSGYITKANDAAVITELDAIKTAAQAANASAGAIDTITIDGNGTTVTVTATTLATSFNEDFKVYYANTSANNGANGTITITAISKFENSSYKNGATWDDGVWTAQ